MKSFWANTEVRFGTGALDSLTEFQGRNAAVVTDSFMASSGNAQLVMEKLSGCRTVSLFRDVVPDPPVELIAKGVRFLQECDADLVVALGGGSAIDAAKGMAFIAKRANPQKNITFIAIPTTSGTGSEVTRFAVITDRQAGVKYPLIDQALLPDIAILDASFVLSAPPSVTADTGLDAITHALEAYMSCDASEISDALAEKSLELAFEYLPLAYGNGKNQEAREKMHMASCLAGMAFSTAGVGICHSIAHQLGAKFHIPHGRANAMLLSYVVEFNAGMKGLLKEENETAGKLAKLARKLGLPAAAVRLGVSSLLTEIRALQRGTKIPSTLAQCNVSREAYEANLDSILEMAMQDACTLSNPRKVTKEDLNQILKHIAVW